MRPRSPRLQGDLVGLRPATVDDVAALVAIRATPEVRSRWGGDDLDADVRQAIAEKGLQLLVVEDTGGRVVGAIQWQAEDDPDYQHAGVDLYLDPAVHNRGFGADAVRTLARYLFEHEGQRRLVIDPAADNHAAIRCYEKVGFRTVGVMRQYERGADGNFHDGVLMDLLPADMTGGARHTPSSHYD